MSVTWLKQNKKRGYTCYNCKYYCWGEPKYCGIFEEQVNPEDSICEDFKLDISFSELIK
jgi:hypothetical protein